MILLLAALAVALGSWWLTGWVRRYALASRLLDIPNERSSHRLPTPRGGGLAIVVVVLGSLPWLALAGLVEWPLAWALLGAGVLVAAIGFLDDRHDVPARWRLGCHFLAAGWVLGWLGGLPPLGLFSVQIELGVASYLLGLFYLVWVLNLFNFMDGIDGIAALEAISVCAGGALVYLCVGVGQNGVVEWLLACAVLGFLIWNFPPARIFLGDAGSGFIGLALGILSLHAAWQAPQLLWSWLILLGVFIVDATFTLLRRLLGGEPVHQAHRTHAYQKAAQRYSSHLPVTLAVGAINLFWLLPLAVMVALQRIEGVLALLVAYAPLLLIALWWRAGSAEPQADIDSR